jgi:hypothetical protein
MDDEGLPWSSLKRKSDKYAKNGEEMMDILVDDIDRYEQLSNQEELLALASALAGNGAVLEVVPTLDRIGPGDVAGIPVAHTQNLLIRIMFLAYLSDFRFRLLHGSPSSSISRLLIHIIGSAFSAK